MITKSLDAAEGYACQQHERAQAILRRDIQGGAMVNGHVDVVRILVRSGANLELQGSGAPGFAGKTALDLAIARDDQEMVDILSTLAAPASE